MAAQQAEERGWKVQNVNELELEEIKKKYKVLLEKISRDIDFDKKWRVLDLGCGPTCISRFLPPADKRGLDPLAGRLGLEGKKISGIKIISGRGEEIPFENNTFQFVLCRNVIDHAENPKKLISEVKRVLSRNGYFILACYVYSRPIAIAKFLSEKTPFLRNVEHPHTFTAMGLERIIRKDFEIVSKYDVYTGYHPNDYGKVNEKKSHLNFLQKLVIFFNYKIFKSKWFLKECCLVLRKKN